MKTPLTIQTQCEAKIGDSIFFACGKQNDVEKILSLARNKIAQDLDIIDPNVFSFCWIVDYPMFEEDEKTKKLSLVIILSLCHKEILKV